MRARGRGFRVGSIAGLAAALAIASCDDAGPPLDPGGEGGVAEITGSVTLEQRAPVEGALVRLVGAAGGAEATSDATGRFALADVPAGDWHVQVVPPAGLAVRTVDRQDVELEAGDHLDLRVDLGASADAGSLVVQVVLDDVTSYAGAELTVLAQPSWSDTTLTDTVATGVTGENGSVFFSLPEGLYVVEITVPDDLHVRSGARQYNVSVLEGMVSWLTFNLDSQGEEQPPVIQTRVIGFVRLNETTPVAGVRVEMAASDIVVPATSDADGRLDFGSASPGAWEIRIDVPEGYTLAQGQANPTTQYLSEHDTLATFDIALADAQGNGIVEVAVSTDSAHTAGIEVRVRRQDSNEIVSAGTTGTNGRYSPLVAPGTYAIEITVPAGFEVEGDGPARIENVTIRSGRRSHAMFLLEPS